MKIIYFDIDTLRPDHLGCYGYERNTSPNIDKIAEEGVKFENYYSSDAPCLPSRTSLLTGKFGIKTGVVGHGGTTADLRIEGENREFRNKLYTETLPSVIKNKGITTVLFSNFPERHSAYHFCAGFNEIYNYGRSTIKADEITKNVLKWLDNNSDCQDWYLHINFWDPHTPYRVPEDFKDTLNDAPVAKWITEEILEKHKRKAGPHGAQEINMFDDNYDPKYKKQLGRVDTLEDVKTLFDGYDLGINYSDYHVGIIMEKLKDMKIYDDVMIIISSDHGENMGELGIYSEHATADNITCRIPFIMKWDKIKNKNRTIEGLHYNLDLLPTMADILNNKKAKDWDGKSYVDDLLNCQDESGHPYLVLSQMAHVCQRSVRFDKFLYMRTYHDGFHLFPKEMLFNLEIDPHEQNNISEIQKEMCMKGNYYLSEWHDKMMEEQPKGYETDPLWVTMREKGPHHVKGKLENYIERLNNTGRSDEAEKLKEKHLKK